MEKREEERVYLKWDKEDCGLIDALIIDGMLAEFRFCKNGSVIDIHLSNVDHVIGLRDALNDLIKEL